MTTAKLKPSELYLAIRVIERRKAADNITPAHVLRIVDLFKEKELKPYTQAEIDAMLRQLLNEGRIEAGRAINDTWIKTK